MDINEAYGVLGVLRDAKLPQIKKAYRLLSRKYHPDNKITGDVEKFREVQEAWEILSGKAHARKSKPSMHPKPKVDVSFSLTKINFGSVLNGDTKRIVIEINGDIKNAPDINFDVNHEDWYTVSMEMSDEYTFPIILIFQIADIAFHAGTYTDDLKVNIDGKLYRSIPISFTIREPEYLVKISPAILNDVLYFAEEKEFKFDISYSGDPGKKYKLRWIGDKPTWGEIKDNKALSSNSLPTSFTLSVKNPHTSLGTTLHTGIEFTYEDKVVKIPVFFKTEDSPVIQVSDSVMNLGRVYFQQSKTWQLKIENIGGKARKANIYFENWGGGLSHSFEKDPHEHFPIEVTLNTIPPLPLGSYNSKIIIDTGSVKATIPVNWVVVKPIAISFKMLVALLIAIVFWGILQVFLQLAPHTGEIVSVLSAEAELGQATDNSVLLLGSPLWASSGDWKPNWSPDGSTIALDNNGIYLANADGSNQRPLVEDSGILFAEWAPYGQRIAYWKKGNGLFLVNIDRSIKSQIYKLPANISKDFGKETAKWSPDGSKIAYFVEGVGVYFTDLFSNKVYFVMRWEAEDGYATIAWSPDSVYFVVSTGSLVEDEVNIVDTVKYNVTNIAKRAYLVFRQDPWLYGGNYLIIDKRSDDGEGRHLAYLLYSMAERKIVDLGNISYEMPSPDKTRMLIIDNNDGFFKVLDFADFRKHSLLKADISNTSGAAWSPNGRYIAFINKQDGQIFKVFVVSEVEYQNSAPKSNGFWFPDSKTVLYHKRLRNDERALCVGQLEAEKGAEISNSKCFAKSTGGNVSPDGKYIIYGIQKEVNQPYEYHVVEYK